MCCRDRREEELRDGHPTSKPWQFGSGALFPAGIGMELRFLAGLRCSLCSQISLMGSQNAQIRVQGGTGGAGMQWESLPSMARGWAGHQQGPLAKPSCSHCKGAVRGLPLSCVLSHLCFPDTFLILCHCLPSPACPQNNICKTGGGEISSQGKSGLTETQWSLLLQTTETLQAISDWETHPQHGHRVL